jgi:YD repeat-containing protein
MSFDTRDNVAAVIDPRTLTTSYTHDGFDEVTKLVSPDTGTSTNTYDLDGNLATATDARNAKGTYSYDALNRLSKVVYTDQTINFTYDAGTNGKGRLTGAADGNHSMSWSYDSLGRVTGKSQTVGATKSVGYGYTNGDMTSLVMPSGQSITYGYTNHQITSIKVGTTTVLSGVTYDPMGPATGWTWGNAATVTRAFDQDYNPHQIVTAGVTNTYAVDSALRITGLSDSGVASNSFTFGYDPLDRVASGVSSATSRGYTYDANSNRLTTTGTLASTETIATTSNRLSATSGGLVRTYGYDAAGNTTSYTGATFTFNQRGRMSSATVSAGATNYLYNALGQLIEKSGNGGGTILLVYDEAGHLLGEYSSAGALMQETVWMGDIPVATLRPNGSTACTTNPVCIFYVHTDHRGTPRKVTTSTSANSLMWR